MIALQTPVAIEKEIPKLAHHQQMMMLGSCFAENMGIWLNNLKFRVDVNPFGILYNPLSMQRALQEILENKEYHLNDLTEYNGEWHSMMHHSDFSDRNAQVVLDQINERLGQAIGELKRLDWLIVTWGTAYVYTLRKTNMVVSNCHKLPEKSFYRRLVEVNEIVDAWMPLIFRLKELNPSLQIIFTVSPIRHLRDGLHENQLSKATLQLAVHKLMSFNEEMKCSLHYFPSYELLMDELRDYRFYADDMVHPSELAVKYIQQRFSDACFGEETRLIAKRCEEVARMVAHKPFDVEGEGYQSFLRQLILKIEQLNEKYPYLDFEKELALCHTRLKK